MPPGFELSAAILVNPHKRRKGNEMGKAIRASALVLVFACSAQAGWIQNGSPQPAPTPAPASAPVLIENDSPAQQPADSEVAPAGNIYIQNDVASALAEAALFFLNSGVLALL